MSAGVDVLAQRRPRSQRAFLGASALLFAASVALTLMWSASMSGSWMWRPMPGQTWPGVAASFLGMWIVMMIAMMLPSLVPALWRYRQAIGLIGQPRLGRLTALVGAGYFLVWALVGLAAFPLGVALSRGGPLVPGGVVLIGGILQFVPWKARHLACWREAPGGGLPMAADGRTAWRHGLRLGFDCIACCAGLTAILLVTGVMDLRTMAAVTAAITAERLVPADRRVAPAIGAVAIGAGALLIARATGFV